MRVRITASARKHGITSGRIRATVANAVFVGVDGHYAMYVGRDDRGIELELGIVPDDRVDGQFAVIHFMPARWRSR